MSRKGIEYGSIPIIPTACRTDRTRSCRSEHRAKYTNELAVMMDSFRPLKIAKQAMAFEDEAYHRSWVDQQHDQFNPPTS